MTKPEKIKVAIFGSCVSRDPFEKSHEIEIVDYYARSSLASMTSAPANFLIDLSPISSEFQRRMIQRDLNKNFMNFIKENKFDIFIMDFTDDRFPILKLPNNTLITESQEFSIANKTNINFLPYSTTRIKPFSKDFLNLWEEGFTNLINISTQYGFSEKILINEIYWAKTDENNNFFKNHVEIEMANDYFRQIYLICKKNLSEHQFIKYEASDLVGFGGHKWGAAPFHYIKRVEENCLNQTIKYHQNYAPTFKN